MVKRTYIVVLTFLDGTSEYYVNEDGNQGPLEALGECIGQYDSRQLLAAEVVDAANELMVYDRCEELGIKLGPRSNYNEDVVAQLWEQAPVSTRPQLRLVGKDYKSS